MAAVLALVMLPIIGAVGFFVSVAYNAHSWSAACAGVAFVALAVGVLVGALHIARVAEGPEPDHVAG
jgi:hypothetical protein